MVSSQIIVELTLTSIHPRLIEGVRGALVLVMLHDLVAGVSMLVLGRTSFRPG